MFPTQMRQYLVERFKSSQLPELPEKNVHIFAKLEDMRRSMMPNKDIGIFFRGRLDMDNTIEGFSGVLLEYLAFQIANPVGVVERHIQLGGAVLLIAAMESVTVLQRCIAKSPALRRQYASLLQTFKP